LFSAKLENNVRYQNKKENKQKYRDSAQINDFNGNVGPCNMI
jgi:hypothetical protein